MSQQNIETKSTTQNLSSSASSIPSDFEIIEKVLHGDQAAFEGIMRRYNSRLFRLARSVLKNDDDAKDVVQEAYVKAYYRLTQFKGPKGFSSWLSKITFNEALARIRSNPMEKKTIEYTDDKFEQTSLQPENIAVTNDYLRIIEKAIDTLPQNFRMVFMMRGVEQLSIAETAESLDLKPATVKTRYHRARTLLKQRLEHQLDEGASRVFSFDGARCDHIVSEVFARLAGLPVSSDQVQN